MKIWLTTFILFSSQLMGLIEVPLMGQAIAQDLSSCSEMGVGYGRTGNPNNVPETCRTAVVAASSELMKDMSQDEIYEVFGAKNLIYVDQYNLLEDNSKVYIGSHLISGNQAGLSNIQALKINEANNKIYLVNENAGQWTLGSMNFVEGGNLAFARAMSSSEIAEASGLAINNTQQKIALISKAQAWIKIFNQHADKNGKRAENATDLIAHISGVQTNLTQPQDIAINELRQEIFVLDSNRILVFDFSSNGNIAPKRLISGASTQLSGNSRIEVDDNGIFVKKADGSYLEFPILGNGNISPQ